MTETALSVALAKLAVSPFMNAVATVFLARILWKASQHRWLAKLRTWSHWRKTLGGMFFMVAAATLFGSEATLAGRPDPFVGFVMVADWAATWGPIFVICFIGWGIADRA